MASDLPVRESSGGDRLKRWIREHSARWNRACGVVIVLSLAAIVWALPVRESAGQFARWIDGWTHEAGPLGAATLLGTYILLGITYLPTWPLPFLAGAAFGPFRGAVIASASCLVTAAVGFGIARGVGRTRLRRYLECSPRLRALEHTIEHADWRIVAAVRVSHMMPFGMQNYAFGLTGIHFWPFLAATWAVTFPGITLQSYIGHLGFSSLEIWQERSAADWQTIGLRSAGLVAIAAAAIYIGYLARSVYRQAVKAELEKEIAAETRSEAAGGRWPRLPIALAAAAAVLLAAAIGALLAQDALRSFLERIQDGTSN